jgi:hypothetical protein
MPRAAIRGASVGDQTTDHPATERGDSGPLTPFSFGGRFVPGNGKNRP